MDLMKIMELMNYNYESSGTELYNIYNKFIETNSDILSLDQLKSASENLLPPQAFDDDRKRSINDYNKAQTTITMIVNKKIEKENTRGMAA